MLRSGTSWENLALGHLRSGELPYPYQRGEFKAATWPDPLSSVTLSGSLSSGEKWQAHVTPSAWERVSALWLVTRVTMTPSRPWAIENVWALKKQRDRQKKSRHDPNEGELENQLPYSTLATRTPGWGPSLPGLTQPKNSLGDVPSQVRTCPWQAPMCPAQASSPWPSSQVGSHVGPTTSDQPPGPAVRGSGSEPTRLQALHSLTVPGAGLQASRPQDG